MANSTKSSVIATEDRVRAIAYALWIEEGRPDGRAEDHWYRAMERVNAEASAEAAPAPGAKRKAPAAAARKASPAKRTPARKG